MTADSTAETPVSDIGKPDPATAGYQSWRQLAFLHWRVAPEVLQPTLPAGLEIETFDNSAWLGLVPFSMEGVRPWWFAPVPRISRFLETNLRTYVRHGSGRAGVWFYSLEASSRIAVWSARTFWNLPYHAASMTLSHRSGPVREARFACQRRGAFEIGCDVLVEFPDTSSEQSAAPGTLEEFLLERYTLFAQTTSGSLRTGQVHHTPYVYSPVTVRQCAQTLTRPILPDLKLPRSPDHAVYSSGVNVRVSPLRPAVEHAGNPSL